MNKATARLYSALFQFSFLTLFFLTSAVQAKEVIHHYDSEIKIETDSSLTVTETITVTAENIEIKRGIYRDFPTRYKDRLGNRYNVDFNLISVHRNGAPEDYHTESTGNGIRIYIGNKNRILNRGRHTFTIRYHTTRQLGFFDDFDELYWNVTGNEWAFPIENASATVYLPEGVTINQSHSEAYTGAAGDSGNNYVISYPNNQMVLFETLSALPLHHGLTVVVNWPKGYVKEPTTEEKIGWFLQDNRPVLVGIAGIAILWIYLYLAWLKVGKDPQRGVIYPRYQPDEQHSPASMRYVQRMGYDHKTFASAIVNMAVKGYLTITENDSFSIRKTGKNVALSLGETALAKQLFSQGKEVTLKQSQHKIIGKAISSHKKVLKRDYEKKFFLTNKAYLIPGWLLSIITLVFTVLSMSDRNAQAVVGFFTVWLSIWSVGVTFLLFAVYNAWKNAKDTLSVIGAVFISAFALPFFAGEGFGLYMMWQSAGSGIIMVFAAIILTNILFYEWIKAPTHRGRALLDKIDGFKLFLTVAEGDEINHKPAPALTPELFEDYFPYAMALDVEKQWGEHFTSLFEKMEQQGHRHSPHWYHGHHWNTHNLSGFSGALGGGLSSAIASSSTAPGSSSGSGGGGSSGGGGGGGGGGGW
jgi:uncharacterized membrane protein